MKTSTITLTCPRDILDAAIAKALAPFRDELLDASKLDRKLYAETVGIHPNKVKADGEKLMEDAANGDEAAMKQLEDADGLIGYVNRRTALFPVKEAARVKAAERFAKVLARVADKLVPAVREAGAVIQKQFEGTMDALNELPGGLSMWDAHVRSLEGNVHGAIRQAEMGAGAAYLLEGLGLLRFVEDTKP
jgi:BMFP domain-containing protein YqiC